MKVNTQCQSTVIDSIILSSDLDLTSPRLKNLVLVLLLIISFCDTGLKTL